jgi:hypothetical protein
MLLFSDFKYHGGMLGCNLVQRYSLVTLLRPLRPLMVQHCPTMTLMVLMALGVPNDSLGYCVMILFGLVMFAPPFVQTTVCANNCSLKEQSGSAAFGGAHAPKHSMMPK